MARTYNEQAPDGSWRQVTQNDNGTYTRTPINPNDYGAANIPGGSSAGGGQVYQTRNGPRTLQQMTTELQGIGGNPDPSNPAAVFAMYQNVDPNGLNGGATGGNTAVNIQAANLAAQTAYQTALIAGMSDRLAFDKATEAWNETFKQKQFETGQANTVVDQAFRQRQADLSQGNTAIDQAFRQGQANNTNALSYLNLQSSLAGRPANAFEYSKLLTGTPGGLADIVRAAGGAYQLPQFGGGAPGNPTPLSIQTMIDDLNRYSPTAGGPQPPTTQPPPTTTAPPATSGPPGTYNTVNGVKTVAEMAQELHVAGWGGNYNDPAALAAGYAETTKNPVTPNAAAPTAGAVPPGTTPQQQAAKTAYDAQYGQTVTPGPAPGSQPVAPGANTYTNGMAPIGTPGAQSNPIPAALSPYIPSYGPLPRGNQLAPQAYNTLDPSQKDLFLGAYGYGGWDPNDIQAQYQRSLRAYGGPSQGAVGF